MGFRGFGVCDSVGLLGCSGGFGLIGSGWDSVIWVCFWNRVGGLSLGVASLWSRRRCGGGCCWVSGRLGYDSGRICGHLRRSVEEGRSCKVSQGGGGCR